MRARVPLKPHTVFLKFDTACCLAAEPSVLFFSPKETYDLEEKRKGEKNNTLLFTFNKVFKI